MEIANEWSYKVVRTRSSTYDFHADEGYGPWANIVVETQHGLVEGYTQQDYACLRFIYNGRVHTRSFKTKKICSRRSIATLAARFAQDISEKT